MPLFTRTRTNPLFYRDQLTVLLRDEPQRLAAMRNDPDSLDVLAWNVFASLDTHGDPQWLAYRLQALGGGRLRAPVRLSLFSGAVRTPYLRPSPDYVAHIRERTGIVGDGKTAGTVDDADTRTGDAADGIAEFTRPIEVPVRIEAPGVLLLVDTARHRLRAGTGGRERLAEVVDAGLDHARRLSSALAIGIVASADSDVLTTRIPNLETRSAIAKVVPWRTHVPPVDIRGLSWTGLIELWQEERGHLRLGGQPVSEFLRYAERAAQ